MEQVQKLLKLIRQAFCKHEYFTHFEKRRMFLRCDYCGTETPGWEVGVVQRTHDFDLAARLFEAGKPKSS